MKEISTAPESGNSLMLEFSAGGGRKPPNSELLRIYQDGTVVYLLGNALPLDEAGLYETTLLVADMKRLSDYLSEHRVFEMSEEYGPLRAGSGFNTLTLYVGNTKKKVKWGAFAEIPEALKELRTRLFDLIQDCRQHAVQTIQVTLDAVAETVEPVLTFQLELSLKNRGTKSVPAFVFATDDSQRTDFRVYAATFEEARNPSILSLYAQSQPLRLIERGDSQQAGNPIEVSPGEEVKARTQAPFILSTVNNYLLYGFFEFTMNVTLRDQPLSIRCWVMTKPADLTK